MSNTQPLRPHALMIDTCIWANSQLGMNRGHEQARDVIVCARRRGIRLGIAPHSLATVFYTVHRSLRRMGLAAGSLPADESAAAAKETAWGVVSNIMEYAEVVGADGSDAHIALLHKGAHDDFEDDLVIAAARRMNADLIVTDDLSFVRHSPLPTMTAEDALRWITSL